ncbi:MAG TPA: TetR/AcrR family transcriptional regulator [Nocardioides sp.]|nr:TetR/AcrR family transcriptional regulator [Nocardioides sp.]
MPQPPIRRTQAERRATTRARILDATAASLVEKGYAATTVSEVQERAGVARGTLQHHFPTRSELLVAATTHVVDLRLAAFRRSIDEMADDTDRIGTTVELAWNDLSGPVFYAAVELWVAARTDPELRANLVAEEERVFREMRTLYAEALGPDLADDPRAATLVEFTVDFLSGLSMTAMLTGKRPEQEKNVEQWKRALAVLAEAFPLS